MSDLEVRGLVAGYGRPSDEPVLRGLDLVVPGGTTTAVLGRSGSGKSTLLRAVAGLVPSWAGSIHLGGRDLADVPTHRRGVGMVFQQLALFPHADVATNVGFGMPEPSPAAVERWLARVGLEGLGGRDVATLSGGQRQRVALVRALAARPAALLLDEPLGAVDAGLRAELLGLLRRLFAEAGTTAVHVTHDPAEAAAIARRVAVLHEGRVVQVDDPHRLWSAPASATVARLVGHPNVLAATAAASLGLRAGAAAVVPPAAVALRRPQGAAGPAGTVVALTAGAAWHATVQLDAGPSLVVAVDPASAPTIEQRVDVVVDASQVLRLPE